MRRLVGLLVLVGACWGAAPAGAVVLPPGFTQTTVWSGLANPTVIRFAPDGRVFVASKNGVVNVFDSTADPTPTPLVDLRGKVHDYWDRGLLGMALDPRFTSGRPFVYVLYAYDKAPNSPQQPRWGDTCPTPPGPTADGCVVTGRLSRISATGAETVLIEDWCQQFPSHSTGSLEFGPDGQLYVSSGDGASFNWADWGQSGNPVNPCGDPGAASPATSQGGALRSQAFRRPAGQALTLDGAILRVNPDTGAASAGNPAIGDADVRRRRIVAYGMRNPFRITFRPGTSEIWSGDVGWNGYEEINRTQNLAQVRNYGWPCYEGPARLGAYDDLDAGSCETLYAQGAGAHAAPYFAYRHSDQVLAGDPCPPGGSSISGLHFYTGAAFGPKYKDALFFSDYTRKCIWVAYRGADGLPDMGTRETFASQADGPAYLTEGPDGALYYADLLNNKVQRIAARNSAPTARIGASASAGAVPLAVNFDGTGSSDPEKQPLSYAWDLDGDGAYDDSASARPSRTYSTAASVTVRLRVKDPAGFTGTASHTVTAGAPPTVTMTAPTTPWAVGDALAFSATSSVPASRLTWSLLLHHCSRLDTASCHTHRIQDWVGIARGSFVAPDHEFPSHLELTVTATDGAGLKTTRSATLMPRTAELTVTSDPAGLQATLGSETLPTPFTRTVLAGSQNAVSAPETQAFEDAVYTFEGWSEASEAGTITTSQDVTVTARFTRPPRTSLAGAELVGAHVATAEPGRGAIYLIKGAVAGTARSLRLYLDGSSRASRLQLALYGDAGVLPAELLAAGRVERPVAGAWNTAALSTEVPIEPGRWYWLSVLNPAGSTGTLAWRDQAGASQLGQTTPPEELSAFPPSWVSTPGYWHVDGHVSGGAWADAAPTPSPGPTPEPPPAPAPTPLPAPIPPAPSASPSPPGPKLLGAWDKPRRFGARTRVTLRAPRLGRAFTLTARVYVTRAGTIAQRGSAFKLTTRDGQVGKAAARLSLPRGRWTRVALTYDGTTVRTYRDGRLVAAKRGGPLPRTTSALRLGGFTGRLDDVRLYDGALPAAQL